jgi:outer membrane protein assembly factor BamB
MRRTLHTTTCLALAFALSACGSDGEQAADGAAATTRIVHDPPLGVPDTPTFTWDGGDSPVAYSTDGAAYAVSHGSILKRDLSSGEVVWNTAIDGLDTTSMAVRRDLDDTSRRDTPLGTVAGEPSLAFTYRKVVEGTGTEADIDEDRVAVVSAKTGALRWDVKLPETGKTRHDIRPQQVLVSGITDDTVVVTIDWDSDEGVGTAAFDGADGSVVWERPDVVGSVAADGMVVARQEDRSGYRPKAWVSGLSARTGTQVWTTAKDGMPDMPYSAGPGLVQFVAMDAKVYKNTLADIRTGHEKAAAPGRCLYDEQSLLVCDGLGKDLVGYRQETLEKLWSIELGARVVPTLITAWHGAVYTSVIPATVVLDGATGKDKVTDLGVEPSAVINGFIISKSRVLPANA